MVRSVNKFLALVGGALLLSSCAGEFSPEDGLSAIQSEKEFQSAFCAPVKLAREVVTGDDSKDIDGYIAEKYSELTDAGLVEAHVSERNSWRSVVDVKLTQKGEEFYDKASTDELNEKDVYYVAVCNLVPEKVLGITEIDEDTVELSYVIVERELTPFGHFLEYKEGREHPHTRRFVRNTFGWELLKL